MDLGHVRTGSSSGMPSSRRVRSSAAVRKYTTGAWTAGLRRPGVRPVCAFERQSGQQRACSDLKPLCRVRHFRWKRLPQHSEWYSTSGSAGTGERQMAQAAGLPLCSLARAFASVVAAHGVALRERRASAERGVAASEGTDCDGESMACEGAGESEGDDGDIICVGIYVAASSETCRWH